MSNHRVYISASTQKENVGAGAYGTEQDRMQYLADRIKYWLETQKGKFTVFRNSPGWTLQQTVADCNKLACAAFVDYHTDAGPAKAQGTTAFYNSPGGCVLANTVYKYAAPLSLGVDRGVKLDTVLYPNGLYVIRNTQPPATLIEMFFHTNLDEVDYFLKNTEVFAKEQAKAFCEFFGEKWTEIAYTTPQTKLTWEQILDKVSSNTEDWKKLARTSTGLAKFLPELIVKIYESR